LILEDSMKKILLCLLVLTGPLAVVSAQATTTERDKPLASINLTRTETINRNLFMKLLANVEKQAKRSLTAPEKRAQLDKQITAIVVAQQAEADRITLSKEELPTDLKDPVYASAAAESGLTPKEVQDTVRIQYLSAKWLQNKQAELAKPEALDQAERDFKLSNKDYEEAYNKNLSSFLRPLIVQFRYISIEFTKMDADQKKAARQTMDDFAKQIKSGGQAKFDELVLKSKDSLIYAGGESPYIRQDTPVNTPKDKEFMSAVFAMAKGGISPVLESGTAYFIVLLSDRREPVLVGIDDPVMPGQKVTPRTNIRQTLLLQANLENTLKKLRSKAEIKLYEENFNW
jgi:parvulin-like peptidyl-prolyl isomerase